MSNIFFVLSVPTLAGVVCHLLLNNTFSTQSCRGSVFNSPPNEYSACLVCPKAWFIFSEWSLRRSCSLALNQVFNKINVMSNKLIALSVCPKYTWLLLLLANHSIARVFTVLHTKAHKHTSWLQLDNNKSSSYTSHQKTQFPVFQDAASQTS